MGQDISFHDFQVRSAMHPQNSIPIDILEYAAHYKLRSGASLSTTYLFRGTCPLVPATENPPNADMDAASDENIEYFALATL